MTTGKRGWCLTLIKARKTEVVQFGNLMLNA